jgi:hypothetical protein
VIALDAVRRFTASAAENGEQTSLSVVTSSKKKLIKREFPPKAQDNFWARRLFFDEFSLVVRQGRIGEGAHWGQIERT